MHELLLVVPDSQVFAFQQVAVWALKVISCSHATDISPLQTFPCKHLLRIINLMAYFAQPSVAT